MVFGFCCPMSGRWQCSAAASLAWPGRCAACLTKDSRKRQRKSGGEEKGKENGRFCMMKVSECHFLSCWISLPVEKRCYASEWYSLQCNWFKESWFCPHLPLCLSFFWMFMVLCEYAPKECITFTSLSLSASWQRRFLTPVMAGKQTEIQTDSFPFL